MALDVCNGFAGFSAETLYSRVQTFYIKPKHDERTKDLRISFFEKATTAVCPGKSLHIQVTDDNDCTLLYSLILTQEDFQVLRTQQNLLVDFDNFPLQFVKLLEMCASPDMPKFILVLDSEDTESQGQPSVPVCRLLCSGGIYLKIMETNAFKNLCHLSLRIVVGSDADIKEYMANHVKILKEKLNNEELRSHTYETRLHEVMSALESKTAELQGSELQLVREVGQLRLDSTRQLSEEREKQSRMQLEWEGLLETQKARMTAAHATEVKELSAQISTLSVTNKTLHAEKSEMDASLRQRTQEVETLREKKTKMSLELSQLKCKVSQLERESQKTGQLIEQLRGQLANKEKDLAEKVKTNAKITDQLKGAVAEKERLRDAVATRDATIGQDRQKIEEMTQENKYMVKKLKETARKSRERGAALWNQEEVIRKNEKVIEQQGNNLKEVQQKLNELTRELTTTKEELEAAKTTLADNQATMKRNNDMITWLTTKMNAGIRDKATPVPAPAEIGDHSRPPTALNKAWPPFVLGTKENGQEVQSRQITPVEVEVARRLTPPTPAESSRPSTGRSTGLDPKYFSAPKDKTKPQTTRPSAYFKAQRSSRTPSINS